MLQSEEDKASKDDNDLPVIIRRHELVARPTTQDKDAAVIRRQGIKVKSGLPPFD